MTYSAIRTVFDRAEEAYKFCWRVLTALRGATDSPDLVSGLLNFQTTLATAVFDLNNICLALEKERKALVRRKNELPHPRFLAGVKRLGRLQEATRDAVDLGKALGDAFAWFFYHKEHAALKQHREHEAITELPTGIGAAGELEFIKNTRVINGHLVLYHAITNILRNGDVSFIDLKDFTLAGLGELKTHCPASGELRVTIHCTSRKHPSLIFNLPECPNPPPPRPQLEPKRDARLKRQLQAMSQSLGNKPKDGHFNLEEVSYLPALDRIGVALKTSPDAYEQCGEGLLLAGYQVNDLQSLFGRLVRRKKDMKDRVHRVGGYVLPLVDKSQSGSPDNANQISIDTLRPLQPVGAVPLLWWPIATDLAERIYFEDVVVVTIFNPAHVVRRLRELGFDVKRVGKSGRHEVAKRIGNAELVVGGLERYTTLVQGQLWSEDLVVRVLSRIDELVKSGKVGVNTRVFLDIQQIYHHAPVA
jgi:hypothetical protein